MFSRVKIFATDIGYAANAKKYKNNKEIYNGHVGDVMGTIRVAIANRMSTPDLEEVVKVMDVERINARLYLALNRQH